MEKIKGRLITVFVDGVWDTALEDREDKTLIIYEIGTLYQMDESLFDSFVDKLEEEGYDCYLSPDIYCHPEWNGIIKYESN